MLGYAAVHFNRVHVDRHLVLKALALYSLVNTAVNLITRKGFGEKVRQAHDSQLLWLSSDWTRPCKSGCELKAWQLEHAQAGGVMSAALT